MYDIIVSIYYYLFNFSIAYDLCSLLFVVGLCRRRWVSVVCIGCTQLRRRR